MHKTIKQFQHWEMRKNNNRLNFTEHFTKKLIFLQAAKNLEMFYFTHMNTINFTSKTFLHKCRNIASFQ